MAAKELVMFIGKCFASKMKKTILVAVPQQVFDKKLNAHFSEIVYYDVYDPEEKCKQGDIVIMKEMAEPLSLKIKHEVEKIIYQVGNVIDPLSGKRCFGDRYIDDVDATSKSVGYQESLQSFKEKH